LQTSITSSTLLIIFVQNPSEIQIKPKEDNFIILNNHFGTKMSDNKLIPNHHQDWPRSR